MLNTLCNFYWDLQSRSHHKRLSIPQNWNSGRCNTCTGVENRQNLQNFQKWNDTNLGIGVLRLERSDGCRTVPKVSLMSPASSHGLAESILFVLIAAVVPVSRRDSCTSQKGSAAISPRRASNSMWRSSHARNI